MLLIEEGDGELQIFCHIFTTSGAKRIFFYVIRTFINGMEDTAVKNKEIPSGGNNNICFWKELRPGKMHYVFTTSIAKGYRNILFVSKAIPLI